MEWRVLRVRGSEKEDGYVCVYVYDRGEREGGREGRKEREGESLGVQLWKCGQNEIDSKRAAVRMISVNASMHIS